MAYAIRVGPTEPRPTHHIKLTDASSNEIGLILCDAKGNATATGISAATGTFTENVKNLRDSFSELRNVDIGPSLKEMRHTIKMATRDTYHLITDTMFNRASILKSYMMPANKPKWNSKKAFPLKFRDGILNFNIPSSSIK